MLAHGKTVRAARRANYLYPTPAQGTMGRLIYTMIASLDGYIENSEGSFQWAAPDEEVFTFTNELLASATTNLLGRRMYETMLYWETLPLNESVTAFEREFAKNWKATDKIVFSRTMKSPSSGKTRIEREFSPEIVQGLKNSSKGDLTIAGPELAAHALRAGLVDELQLLIVPKLVGGGKPWLPSHLRIDLELLETRRFASGFVFLRYGPRPPAGS